jgi:hypothetical protein
MGTAATPPPVDPSVAGAPQDNSWEAAAQPPMGQQPNPSSAPPSTPAPPPGGSGTGTPGVQPTDVQRTDTIASQAAPAYVTPPLVTSQKRGGLLGVMDDIANALTGKTTPEIGKDADGNEYVKQDTLSRGQQWVRIGAGLLGGAAKGWAAGRGRNPGAAAAAGFDEGERQSQQQQQQQTQVSDQVTKDNLARANMQQLQMNMAEQAWKAKRMGVEASQHDIEFNQQQVDRLTKPVKDGGEGGQILGIMRNPNDIDKILALDPNVFQALIQKGTIRNPPHYDADGKVDGNYVIKMPDNYGQGLLPPGQEFRTLDSATGEPIISHTSDYSTKQEMDTLHANYQSQLLAYNNNKTEQDLKKSETAEHNANATKVPSEIAKNKGEMAQAYAEAAEHNANATKTRQDLAAVDGTDPSLTHQTIVNGMLDGSVDITKAVGIFKDPHAREAYIAEAKQQDPDWTMQKYQTMLKMRQDLTSGKLGDQVQSFNAFLGHANGVSNTVNTLRNTNSPYINHTINWLRQNVSNNPVVASMLPEIDATRAEFQNFISNHALQKSEIDKGEKLLSEAQTPAQMQAAIKSFMQVALTRLGSIQYRSAQTFGDKTPQLISPQNVQAVRSLGLAPYANNYGLLPHAGTGTQPQQQATPGAGATQQLRAQAVAAGVPATAMSDPKLQIAHDAQGRVVGYQDAAGYHALGGR